MPLRETLKRDAKARSGMCIGGIGSGGIELRKDGVFYNWHIFNNAPFGSGPRFEWNENATLFFVVRYQVEGEEPRLKLLQIDEGSEVAGIPNHVYTFPWLTGVDRVDYEASYPFTRMRFTDAEMPLEVTMTAFTPFIPHNIKDSSLPGAYFDFAVRSRSTKPVHVLLLTSLVNAAGYDVPRRRFTVRVHEDDTSRMFESGCALVDPSHVSYGTQAMLSCSRDSTYYLGWEHRHPYYEHLIRNQTLADIDDTEGRNYGTDEATGEKIACGQAKNSIGVSRLLTPGESLNHSFVMAWHFPNLYSDLTRKDKQKGREAARRLEGHYYSNFFESAAQVATYMAAEKERLETLTREFHSHFYDSSLPTYVLDQINSNLNTFTTSSWLTRDMDFGIQEGMTPEQNFGPLATIDVALYGSIATAALFPELDKAMIRAHARLQRPSGEVSHGIGRNFALHDVHEGVKGRLDLPSQYVILALRAFYWTNDHAYLQEIWPSVTAALDYVLRERDMNGDLLPDMEGAMCTYDNFPMFGAASYVSSLWLAALAYAIAAAESVGDTQTANRYTEVLVKGSAAFEKKLWNGSYYSLYNDANGARGDRDEGCLTDQVIGEWAGHQVGFPGLLDPAHVKRALRSILSNAYHPQYGLRNCRWPDDGFLHPVDENCWSDQANTCWTGIELAFASLLLYKGFTAPALRIVRNVDKRYRKAGLYFDHQEFGGHYFRPMSAWGLVNAAAGLAINGDQYTFAPRLRAQGLNLFFAFGHGTGHYVRHDGGRRIEITIHSGSLQCSVLRLGHVGLTPAPTAVSLSGGDVHEGEYQSHIVRDMAEIRFAQPLTVGAGQTLTVDIT